MAESDAQDVLVADSDAQDLPSTVAGSDANCCFDCVDDLYLALEAAEEELLPMSDEKFADALQFQEVVMASIMCSTSTPKMIPHPPARCQSSPTPDSTSLLEGQPSLFVCGICMEPKELSETFQNRPCAHRFCVDCTRQHLTVRTLENASAVPCPGSGCQARMEPEWCRGIIPGEAFERWSAVFSEATISASNRIYCPYGDCSALLEDESKGEIGAAECPHCHRLFCAKCKVPWHADLECEEYRLGEGSRNDILLKKLAEEQRWTRCPECKFYVEKVDGCFHITCRCTFHFCYRCGDAWTEQHYGCQK